MTGYVVKRWYRSNIRDGIRKVQPLTRWRQAPVRRARPGSLRVLKNPERISCAGCGAITRNNSATCAPCFESKSFRDDQARLRRAKIVPASEHDDYVYADGYGYHDGYFDSMECLLEYCAEEGIDPPCYVHPCDPTSPPSICISSLLEQITEEEHEDFDANDLVGVEDLEAAVKVFNDKQKSYSFMWDESRVIVLDEAEFERLLSTDRRGLPDIRYRRPTPMLRKETVQT